MNKAYLKRGVVTSVERNTFKRQVRNQRKNERILCAPRILVGNLCSEHRSGILGTVATSNLQLRLVVRVVESQASTGRQYIAKTQPFLARPQK